MELHVHGPGPAAPFLSARDRFVTEHQLDYPVRVQVKEDPEERTWTTHRDDHHLMNISRTAATSAMATELTIHELSHMLRHEEGHPSHVQSTREAIYLALAGTSVERHKLTHCYQIANHMKDIYADDITLRVGSPEKLVNFLEAKLATALNDRPPAGHSYGQRVTATADPEMTAVNSAFALALLERHDLVDTDHRIYDLANAAAADAPGISLSWFKNRFRSLQTDPHPREYKQQLVDLTRAYAGTNHQAAD